MPWKDAEPSSLLTGPARTDVGCDMLAPGAGGGAEVGLLSPNRESPARSAVPVPGALRCSARFAVPDVVAGDPELGPTPWVAVPGLGEAVAPMAYAGAASTASSASVEVCIWQLLIGEPARLRAGNKASGVPRGKV